MKKDEADAQRLHFLKWYRKSRQGFYCSQLDDQEMAAAGFYEGIHYAIAALTGSDQAVMSRSVQRHEALQRGEPMPDFTGSERPEGEVCSLCARIGQPCTKPPKGVRCWMFIPAAGTWRKVKP